MAEGDVRCAAAESATEWKEERDVPSIDGGVGDAKQL